MTLEVYGMYVYLRSDTGVSGKRGVRKEAYKYTNFYEEGDE